LVKQHNNRKPSQAQSDFRTLKDSQEKFQGLADTELAATQVCIGLETPAGGNQSERWLRAYAGPETNWKRGQGKDQDRRPGKVVYRLSSGFSGQLREDFKLTAVTAGRAIGASPEAALDTWLAACFRYARQDSSEYLRFASPSGGLILRVCQVSANLCSHLLQQEPESKTIKPLAATSPGSLNFRSELRRVIALVLAKHPKANNRQVCQFLDDECLEVPDSLKAAANEEFFELVFRGSNRHKIESQISKVRVDMRNRGLFKTDL